MKLCGGGRGIVGMQQGETVWGREGRGWDATGESV